jgi:hypothetical protein
VGTHQEQRPAKPFDGKQVCVERMRELVQQAMQRYNSSWKKTVDKVWETEEEYCKQHAISSFEQKRVTVYIPLDEEEEEATAEQVDAQAEENPGRPESAAEDRVAKNFEPSADSSSSLLKRGSTSRPLSTSLILHCALSFIRHHREEREMHRVRHPPPVAH